MLTARLNPIFAKCEVMPSICTANTHGRATGKMSGGTRGGARGAEHEAAGLGFSTGGITTMLLWRTRTFFR
jgi:hypothetical protein